MKGILITKRIYLALEKDNEEGFVIRFNNGLRVKLKFDSYKRLHNLRSHLSTSSILENLKNGEDVLGNVPDEFYDFVEEQMNNLMQIFINIQQESIEVLNELKDLPSRKDIALAMSNKETHIKSIVFATLDNKPFAHIIWSYIEKNKNLFSEQSFEW